MKPHFNWQEFEGFRHIESRSLRASYPLLLEFINTEVRTFGVGFLLEIGVALECASRFGSEEDPENSICGNAMCLTVSKTHSVVSLEVGVTEKETIANMTLKGILADLALFLGFDVEGHS